MHRLLPLNPLTSIITLFVILASILLPARIIQAHPLAVLITETFEDESAGSTTFSQGGITFNTTGDLLVEFFSGLGCCPSDYWLGTGFNSGGGTNGSAGKIILTTPGIGFQINEMDAWTSFDDGNNFVVGDVTFVGTLATGGTVSDTLTITPTGNTASDLDHISFAGTALDGQILTELEIILISPVNYIELDNLVFDTAALFPEIDVQGNGNSVADGDTTPDTVDGTDFGSVTASNALTHTFTISNSGRADLMLTGLPAIALTNGTHFNVTQPAATTLAPGETTTFTVAFAPQSTGSFTDTITIANNDSDENPYTFAIAGTGLMANCYASLGTATDYVSADAQAVRDAVNAAAAGGTVKVAGNCAGVAGNQVLTITKNITLTGGYTTTNWSSYQPGVYTATLDAKGAGRVVSITGNIEVNLLNLLVTNGKWTLANQHGGGIYVNGATLTLSNTVVYSNSVTGNDGGGGGVYSNQTLTMINTTVQNNTSQYWGGGVYGSALVRLEGGLFENNRNFTANGFGGGVLAGSLILTDTQFLNNTSFNSGGGALALGSAVLKGGLFQGNRSTNGGTGAFYANGGVRLTGTQFINNRGFNGGAGALYLPAPSGDSVLVNALFAGNQASTSGSAMEIATPGRVQIIHTTIASPTVNNTSAIYISGGGTVNITDTIIASHTIGIQNTGDTVNEDYNLFYGNTTNLVGTITSGGNSIIGDPAFADPDGANYQLTNPSYAINNGIDAGVTEDYLGNVRPGGGGFDIGYHETTFATEMAILGNSLEIAAGDTTPDAADETDFGSVTVGNVLSHTFTLSNEGTANLYLTGLPQVALTNGTAFNLTQPASTTLKPGETTPFTIAFAPQSVGSFTDTVTIVNNDSNENPYTFVIAGTAVGPAIEFGQSAYIYNEDGTAVGASVTLTRTASTGASSVQVNFTDNTATGGLPPLVDPEDFDNTPQTITFSDGQISQAVAITINDDALDEVNETLTMTLSAPLSATLGANSSASLTIIDNDAASPGVQSLYLPLILKDFIIAPDLVITDLQASSSAVTVTIRNTGNAPVVDAFWVDVYFNPSKVPALNEPWDTIAGQGVTWGLVGSDLPIDPGQSRVLTLATAAPGADLTSPPPYPAGATVYALADSVNFSTSYGAVQESDESNNLAQSTVTAAGTGSTVQPAATGQSPPPAVLPRRDRSP